jgi:hypothetical protein
MYSLLQVCPKVVPLPVGARCTRPAVRQPAAAQSYASLSMYSLLKVCPEVVPVPVLVHPVPAWLYANLLQPNPMLVFYVLSSSGLP